MSDDRADVHRFLAERSDDAFAVLYDRHAPAMYALARHLLGAAGGADDALQEAWIRAIRKLPDFRGDSALRTWLCGFVVNCCRERFRGPLFEPLRDDLAALPQNVELPLAIESALALLAPGYRTVVLLHDLEGFTHEEIGAVLNIDAGTSKSQLSRGRQQLRRILAGQTKEHAS